MFDIEPVTFIMSFILMCAFSIPFVYSAQKNKRKIKAIKAKLQEVAKSMDASPSEVEIWRNRYAFGLDPSQNKLIYLREEEDFVSYKLDLREFRKASLIKHFQEVDGKQQTTKLPEYLAIELTPVAADAKLVTLEIYDAEHYSDLLGETVLAEKWINNLNNRLN